ncbi:L,D-transpeptidase family protein [Streptomyces sp. NRRL S-340]|uniref:L,D-transpeptidase family protein n=1 Tax=Streptomyces sp. NRRL S-340 TaxID=1463901 RepID=UPI00056C4E1C|nr:L,D-transpeptidase family protein [Streptomyces sp. NRRL S-340]
MRRAAVGVAAAVALTGVYGCTVQPTGPGGATGAGPGSGTASGSASAGRHRSPVHIEAPATRPGGGKADGKDGSGSAGGGGGPGGDARTAPAAAPAAGPVLWSRGDSGQAVRELQARLRQIGWLSQGPTGTYGPATEQAVRGFQGRRGLPRTGRTDTVTWQRLRGMTHEPGRWELYLMGGQPAGAPDPRCLTGRVLCIDKTTRTLRWMTDGRTVSTMAVRFGTEATPTREGVFQVYWKSRHHVSTIYHSAMPYAMFFSGGQAVHYSSDFAARGYAGGSHGCVNVRDEAAIARMFAQVKVGDKVVVHW